MDRRSFLKTSAVAGVTATGLAAPAIAQGNVRLTMVTTWPRGFAGVADAADKFAEDLAIVTDGEITVDVKHAGELIGALEVFDAVTAGQADMYHGADYYFLGQHPALGFFTSVPFGMTATELNTWYYHGNGRMYHDTLGEIFGLKSFLAGNTGAQAGGWFRQEISGPEDFNGIKFRMPGQGGLVLSRVGASVQNIPGGEVYQALASGAIDATEWIGPWADEKAGFLEITKFYYTAGFHEPGAALSVATNLEVFNNLAPRHQKAIEVVAANTNVWNLCQFLSQNGPALQRLQSEGVKVLEFPDSVWDAFGAASAEVFDELAEADDLYAEILADYRKSMRETSGWITLSSGAFRAQRDRIFG